MQVPEEFPYMPIVAISRNPVFPRFIKIVELSDNRLINLIRRKVKLGQPYVGVFLKTDPNNDKEVVYSVKDLHTVGTFCGIVEMQDMGDKLRMIVMAHRRIRLIGQMVLDEKELEAEEAALAQQQGVNVNNNEDTGRNGSRRRRRRMASNKDSNAVSTSAEEEEISKITTSTTTSSPLDAVLSEDESEFEPVPVLMIEAENVKPLKFQVDTEMKVSYS
jgi:Lon-like ATP-dependent protease